MSNNRETLESLFANNRIDIRRGSIFDVSPESMPYDLDFGKVKGMMLGLAIGDSLGKPTEGMLPATRRDLFGEIRDYMPTRYAYGPIGVPSDDTQLAFWTLEQMIADGGLNPDHLAQRFCRERIFGIGSTVKKALHNYKSGVLWYECGQKGAGNGALMRIAPMVIPHLRKGTTDLWVDTALSAMITHNDSCSISACLAFVGMLWDLLQMREVPESQWWPKTFVKIAQDLEINDNYRGGGKFAEYKGFMSPFVEEKVVSAYRRKLSVLEACEEWHSGAYLMATISCVLYILMRHSDDPEEAIVRAVNDTKDNDTIAAIVGAAVGALHGKDKLPERWVKNLSGRTTFDDDGRAFELLREAKEIWGN